MKSINQTFSFMIILLHNRGSFLVFFDFADKNEKNSFKTKKDRLEHVIINSGNNYFNNSRTVRSYRYDTGTGTGTV